MTEPVSEIEPLTLTPAEQKLIDAAARGKLADYSSTDLTKNDPAQGADWGAERTLRAEIVYALATNSNPAWPVHPKGVRLIGAKIAGQLDFEAAKLPRPLALRNCHIEQQVVFKDASAHSIDLCGCYVPGGVNGSGLRVEHDVSLGLGFAAKGEVRLLGATVGGLDCAGGSFENPGGDALSMDFIEVKGHVFLRQGFAAKGEVRLLGATVGGQLGCAGASFENPKGKALSMDGIEVKGSVLLAEGFAAKGEVRLPGATVGGQVDCAGGSFENADKTALNMDGIEVKRNVFLGNGFAAKGEVRLSGARVGGLDCEDGSFENPGGDALSLDSAVIKGPLFVRENFHAEGTVNLGNATVGMLADDEEAWPQKGQLVLEGFTYKAIHEPCEASKRLDWLARQPEFHPQPYEQLARVLREMGRERDAREILFAKHQRLRKAGGLGPLRRLSNRFLELTVGYGYKPLRALGWIVLVFLLGSAVASVAWRGHMIVPSQAGAGQAGYPTFHATLYSLDQFSLPPLHIGPFSLPPLDLGQKKYWRPVARGRYDPRFWAFQIYFILHALAGWTLAGLLIAALTGIIKKE